MKKQDMYIPTEVNQYIWGNNDFERGLFKHLTGWRQLLTFTKDINIYEENEKFEDSDFNCFGIYGISTLPKDNNRGGTSIYYQGHTGGSIGHFESYPHPLNPLFVPCHLIVYSPFVLNKNHGFVSRDIFRVDCKSRNYIPFVHKDEEDPNFMEGMSLLNNKNVGKKLLEETVVVYRPPESLSIDTMRILWYEDITWWGGNNGIERGRLLKTDNEWKLLNLADEWKLERYGLSGAITKFPLEKLNSDKIMDQELNFLERTLEDLVRKYNDFEILPRKI